MLITQEWKVFDKILSLKYFLRQILHRLWHDRTLLSNKNNDIIGALQWYSEQVFQVGAVAISQI